ncbi:hypothetical protein WQ57_14770 [Mesobacillus campisalis]|uniref:Uncharacterized protein n=1 Tax=Mesobacillus campisalis TaxID=1408103 RepID=A0A0M2SW66_9BACI|nr:hypothetical protein [Mesobacillus campisalis]KKK37217.1 hypothetical protein WQ57_14770 [Mesobacillus campisalis]
MIIVGGKAATFPSLLTVYGIEFLFIQAADKDLLKLNVKRVVNEPRKADQNKVNENIFAELRKLNMMLESLGKNPDSLDTKLNYMI